MGKPCGILHLGIRQDYKGKMMCLDHGSGQARPQNLSSDLEDPRPRTVTSFTRSRHTVVCLSVNFAESRGGENFSRVSFILIRTRYSYHKKY